MMKTERNKFLIILLFGCAIAMRFSVSFELLSWLILINILYAMIIFIFTGESFRALRDNTLKLGLVIRFVITISLAKTIIGCPAGLLMDNWKLLGFIRDNHILFSVCSFLLVVFALFLIFTVIRKEKKNYSLLLGENIAVFIIAGAIVVGGLVKGSSFINNYYAIIVLYGPVQLSILLNYYFKSRFVVRTFTPIE